MSTAAHESRRRFLRRVGTTIAAGLGAVAFGADRAGAARDHGTGACTLYCRPSACPGGCPPGCNEFLCKDACDGSEYYTCMNRTCTSHCLMTVCV